MLRIILDHRVHSTLVILFSSMLIPWDVTNVCSATNSFDYAVQVEPVIFLQEPISKLIKVGDILSLSCQARVAQLVNQKQPLPTVSWLKDKIQITPNMPGVTITTNSSIGLTKLVVHQANAIWAGSYECLATDAKGKYVTISRKATVFVVSQDAVPIKAYIGQPLFLPCSPSPGHVTSWMYNNQPVNESFLLSDGSLYISKIDFNHHGTWQCYNTYNITTSVTVEMNDSLSKPVAVIDYDVTMYSNANTSRCGSPLNVSVGCPVYLSCQIAGISKGLTPVTVTWHVKTNNTTIIHQESRDEMAVMTYHYIIKSFNVSDSGHYFCSFNLTIDNSTVIVGTQELIMSIKDDAPTTDIVQDIFLPFDGSNSVLLNCGSGSMFPFTSLYWTRNGEIINSSLYHTDNAYLDVNKETFHNVFAVYECFIEGIHDIRYSIHRILVKYLCNPPGNLKIRTHTNVSNYYLPYLHLTWIPPVQRGGVDAIAYSILILSAGSAPYAVETSPSSQTNSTIIELANDAVYFVTLSINRPNVKGIQSSCSINTLERFVSANRQFDQLKCTDNGHVMVKWSPLGIQPELNPTEDVTIKGNCVYKGEIFKFQVHIDLLYKQYQEKISGLLPGTICEFYGEYSYVLLPPSVCDSDKYILPDSFGSNFEIPRKTCQVQEEQSTGPAAGGNHDYNDESVLMMYMVCGLNELRVEWTVDQEMICRIMNNISATDNETASFQLYVFGVCVHKDEQVMFNHTIDLITHPFGFITIDNISAQSICSIDANTTTFSQLLRITPSAQCGLDDGNSGSFISSGYNVYNQSINCSSPYTQPNHLSSFNNFVDHSFSAGSMPPHNVLETPNLTFPVTDTNKSITVEPDLNYLLTIVAAVCLIVFVTAVVFVTVSIVIVLRRYRRSLKRSWSLNEVDPKHEPQINVFNYDACSIKTELEGFRTTESTEPNDLNIYQGYTVEENPNRPDTTGSSGYGSEITTQCTIDYHCKKLKEVSEDADNCVCVDYGSACSNSLSDSEVESSVTSILTRQKFLNKDKERLVMCAVCKSVKAHGSLTRLCPCVMRGGQEYIRLTALNKTELHTCSSSCTAEDFKECSTTNRLSTLFV